MRLLRLMSQNKNSLKKVFDIRPTKSLPDDQEGVVFATRARVYVRIASESESQCLPMTKVGATS